MNDDVVADEELEDLLALFKQHLNESQYSKHWFVPAKAIAIIQAADAEDNHKLFRVKRDDELVGYLYGIISDSPVADFTMSCEYGFYVKPEYRGSRAAYRLIEAYVNWAREMNADYITVDNTTYAMDTEEAEKVANFFERLGFEHTSTTYTLGGVAH